MTLKRIIIQLFILLAIPTATYASKAFSRSFVVTLTNGQQVTASLRGDEHFHYYITSDEQLLIHDEDGTWHIATEEEMAAASTCQAKANALRAPSEVTGAHAFPHTGTPKALVILVNFSDVKLSHTNEEINEWLNGTSYHPFNLEETDHYFSYGSVAQYFNDCSYGQFRPQFDVVGPYTLSKTCAYYGQNHDGSDKYSCYMECLKEASQLADADIDYKQYDSDNDGYVDLVYILYAGYGENTGGGENTIWSKSGYNSVSTNDGKTIYRYGFSNELLGYPGIEAQMGWSAPKMTGIGVFCHEMCHTLGLPDVYPTMNWYVTKYDNQSMEEWDLMDGGENTQATLYPMPLSAWERSWLGWTKEDGTSPLQEITSNGTQTVKTLGLNGTALKLTNPNDASKNEFYTIETMYRDGWYRFVPASGLLVTHINYSSSYFSNFSYPNNVQGSPRWTILPANGTLYSSYRAQDCTLNANGDTISKGANFMSANELTKSWKGNVYPGTQNVTSINNWKAYNGTLNYTITDIAYSNGISTFTLNGIATGISPITNTNEEDTNSPIYTIDGRMVGTDASSLPRGIYIRNGHKFVKTASN